MNEVPTPFKENKPKNNEQVNHIVEPRFLLPIAFLIAGLILVALSVLDVTLRDNKAYTTGVQTLFTAAIALARD